MRNVDSHYFDIILLSFSFPELSSVRVKELCELLSYWNGSSFICKSQVRFVPELNVSLLYSHRNDNCYFVVSFFIRLSDLSGWEFHQAYEGGCGSASLPLTVSEIAVTSTIR